MSAPSTEECRLEYGAKLISLGVPVHKAARKAGVGTSTLHRSGITKKNRRYKTPDANIVQLKSRVMSSNKERYRLIAMKNALAELDGIQHSLKSYEGCERIVGLIAAARKEIAEHVKRRRMKKPAMEAFLSEIQLIVNSRCPSDLRSDIYQEAVTIYLSQKHNGFTAAELVNQARRKVSAPFALRHAAPLDYHI